MGRSCKYIMIVKNIYYHEKKNKKILFTWLSPPNIIHDLSLKNGKRTNWLQHNLMELSDVKFGP